MNLTEPHCGTDLGLLKTRAEPNDDGSYSITGTKIFISSGEHDLAENIIHLVLAKIAGAPDNVKGISLFVVPKFLVNEDGSLGERNAVSCGALEKKMGIHGNATCVMNYDGAKGWLIGEPEKGLAGDVHHDERGPARRRPRALPRAGRLSEAVSLCARPPAGPRAQQVRARPDAKADPIIVHPDVRRMLMEARACNEAGRALVLWGALPGRSDPPVAGRERAAEADDLLGLITPVIKGYLTDKGFKAAVDAHRFRRSRLHP